MIRNIFMIQRLVEGENKYAIRLQLDINGPFAPPVITYSMYVVSDFA